MTLLINDGEQHKSDVLNDRQPRRLVKNRFQRDACRRLRGITERARRDGREGNR